MREVTWRLLYVRAQCEGRYQALLAERCWSTYVPRETVWRGDGPRRQPFAKPLVPGWVFADLTDDQLACRPAGASEFLRVSEAGQDELDKFVVALKAAEAKGRYDHTRKAVKEAKLRGKALPVGAGVTVISGPFAEHTGFITEPLNKRSARVTLTMFGQDLTVTMDFAELQAILPEEETLAA